MKMDDEKEIKPICEVCKEYSLCLCRFESSPIRDTIWFGMKAVMRDGLCYFEDGTIIDPSQPIDEDKNG